LRQLLFYPTDIPLSPVGNLKMAPFSGLAPFLSIIIHACTNPKQIASKNLNHYDHYCCLNHTRRPHSHPHGIHSSHALRAHTARIHHQKNSFYTNRVCVCQLLTNTVTAFPRPAAVGREGTGALYRRVASHNNCIPRRLKLSTIEVTAKAIFERLYLVSC